MKTIVHEKRTWVIDGGKIEIAGKTYDLRPDRAKRVTCPHLGPPIERDGITIKVKCGCSGKEQEQPHAAHKCELHNRCLPTLRPVDPAKWLEREESKLYRCCSLCPDNPATKPIG